MSEAIFQLNKIWCTQILETSRRFFYIFEKKNLQFGIYQDLRKLGGRSFSLLLVILSFYKYLALVR